MPFASWRSGLRECSLPRSITEIAAWVEHGNTDPSGALALDHAGTFFNYTGTGTRGLDGRYTGFFEVVRTNCPGTSVGQRFPRQGMISGLGASSALPLGGSFNATGTFPDPQGTVNGRVTATVSGPRQITIFEFVSLVDEDRRCEQELRLEAERAE